MFAAKGPLTYPDVNVVLEAVQAFLRAYREARKSSPQLSLSGIPVASALATSTSPQARSLSAALQQGTLISSDLLRFLVAANINSRIQDVFGTGARIKDPRLLRSLANTVTGEDGHHLTHAPPDELLDFMREASASPEALRGYLYLSERGQGDPVVDLALGPVRSQLEAVAPQTLKSNLLLDRPWYASGPAGDESPVDISQIPRHRLDKLIEDRDRTAVDGEDLLHLALCVQAAQTYEVPIVLATGDQRLAEALTQARVHANSYPHGLLNLLEVEHYTHSQGSWKTAQKAPPTENSHRGVPYPVSRARSGQITAPGR